MSDWFIPPAKEMKGDLMLGMLEAQELLLSTYIEEQDKWNKDIISIEKHLLSIERELGILGKTKDRWWERALCRIKSLRYKTKRQMRMCELEQKLDILQRQYEKRIVDMPKVDMFELGMYGSRLFKSKG